jgi:hypothetical protein
VDPDGDGKVISSLSASRADNVESQAILRDGVTESRGIGTITKADVAIFSSITRLVPRVIERLGCRKTKRASRRLSIRDTEEEFLVVVLVAHTMIRSVAKIDRWRARNIIRVWFSIDGRRGGQCQAWEHRKNGLKHRRSHFKRLSTTRNDVDQVVKDETKALERKRWPATRAPEDNKVVRRMVAWLVLSSTTAK